MRENDEIGRAISHATGMTPIKEGGRKRKKGGRKKKITVHF